MSLRQRLAVLLLLPLWGAACGASSEVNIEAAEVHGDDVAQVSLEGEALTAELAQSPSRESPVPFARLGLLWDAPQAAVVEVAYSADGEAWSDYRSATVHDVQNEGTNSYVGSVSVPEGVAQFYRVRAGEGAPTFLSLQFFSQPLGEVIEGGEVSEAPSEEEQLASDLKSLSQGLTVGEATVNSRAAWGAARARCASFHAPTKLTIHHTVTPTLDLMSPQSRLRQIQAFHQNVQGWCDIGYHFLVSRDGQIWEGRPAGQLGSHVGGNNTGNLGISFMGTFITNRATETQINKVAVLVKGLASKYPISVSSTEIKGHRQYGGTTCPGDALFAQIPTLIARARTSDAPTLATVRGFVYRGSDTSARLSGATVTLGTKTTTTDGNGNYQFTGIRSGTYTMTAAASGYVKESVARSVAGTDVTITFGLSPVPLTTVKGLIYVGNDTAKRLSNATVKLGSRTATTGADGTYSFANVSPGAYTVTASASGYLTESVVRDVQGTETWASIGLAPAAPAGTAVLTGIIYRGTDTSARVAGALVTLANGRSATSNSDGVYTLSGLGPGDYVVRASKSGVGSGSATQTAINGQTRWASVSLR